MCIFILDLMIQHEEFKEIMSDANEKCLLIKSVDSFMNWAQAGCKTGEFTFLLNILESTK